MTRIPRGTFIPLKTQAGGAHRERCRKPRSRGACWGPNRSPNEPKPLSYFLKAAGDASTDNSTYHTYSTILNHANKWVRCVPQNPSVYLIFQVRSGFLGTKRLGDLSNLSGPFLALITHNVENPFSILHVSWTNLLPVPNVFQRAFFNDIIMPRNPLLGDGLGIWPLVPLKICGPSPREMRSFY